MCFARPRVPTKVTTLRVIVLGGYGVFGTKVSRLLRRDGHDVWVAGRTLSKAQELADKIGARPLALDRASDLSDLPVADVFIDAAGPFHAYGDDPYRLPRLCLERGLHYLDLCDDGAFCAGITVLDGLAKSAGRVTLSGVSSVPALSSVVVATLAAGADIDTIDTAILPGNRAPRGRSVIASILNQTGRDFDISLSGQKTSVRSWSQPEIFDIGQGVQRAGYMIEVPDQRLFPVFFHARTVRFYAGLELGLMNRGLAVFSWLRGVVRFPVPNWTVSATQQIAGWLMGFGTDIGGMSVHVTCGKAQHSWRMLAQEGQGPFIPAVAARAILRNLDQIKHGARPALAELPLAAMQNAMSDLSITFERDTRHLSALLPLHVKGFDSLPNAVQASHENTVPNLLKGRAKVTRGTGIFPRLIAAIMRFPKATADTPVSVLKQPTPRGETWIRRFGPSTFRSHLTWSGTHMIERFGPMRFTLDLTATTDGLAFPVRSGRVFGLPIPKALLPKSVASETEHDGVFHFDVQLLAPLTGQIIVHYQGWLKPA